MSFLSQLSLINKMRDVNPNAIQQKAVRCSHRRMFFSHRRLLFSHRRLLFLHRRLLFFTSSLALFTALFALFAMSFTLQISFAFPEYRSFFQNIVRFSRILFVFPEYRSFSQNIVRFFRLLLLLLQGLLSPRNREKETRFFAD